MIHLLTIQNAIREENLDGWLFTTHHHRDLLSEKILGIDSEGVYTRPWYYFIPRNGVPLKIVHGIEPHGLTQLPGETSLYTTRSQLQSLLSAIGPAAVAVQYSTELPIISFIDHGTALFLQECGLTLVPSASLIQRTTGLLDEDGIRSHERTAAHLYEIVNLIWEKICDCSAHGSLGSVSEGDVRDWILSEFQSRNLETDSSPIVASGIRSSDPHYSPEGAGSLLRPGEVLQLDLWAKEHPPGSIYADISWVGFTGSRAPETVITAFNAVREARDSAVQFIRNNLASGNRVRGADVDIVARNVIISKGFETFLRHRTGHGIDTDPHGSGVNLDGVEFPDSRYILEGSCFSVEPGVYLENFGLRTEINVFIRNGVPVISGGVPQKSLLTFPETRIKL